MGFIVGFGVVSALGDVVYEGARSIIGPYLAHLGASAEAVGLITGAGEALALVLRLFTGHLVDRTRRPWPQTIVGYGLTMICVPLIALSGSLWQAALLYNGERFGKGLRTPARDTLLAHASAKLGRGYAFGLHKAMDQGGALSGPLLIGVMLGLGAGYRPAFAVLAIPAVVSLLVLAWLRSEAPDPRAYEPTAALPESKRLRLQSHLPGSYWLYAAFSAATMLGFSTWAVLAFHLVDRTIVTVGWVPVLYAAAMAAAGLAAVVSGHLYDRIGLRGLIVLPPLAALVPFLSFTTSLAAVSAGAIVWGVVMGIHESTMRAAVTDLVPAHRRGAGFGTFTAVYGLAWLAGSVLIGFLYDRDIRYIQAFVLASQLLAMILLVVLLWRFAHTKNHLRGSSLPATAPDVSTD